MRARGLAEPWLARARRSRAIRLAVTVGLMAVALSAVGAVIVTNREKLLAEPWRFDLARFVLAMVLQASTVGIATWVWFDLSAQLGAERDLRRAARAFAYAMFARRLPGAIWHAVARAAYYGEEGLGKRIGVAGSLLEAGLLVLTGTAMALITFEAVRPYGIVLGIALLAAAPALVGPLMRRVFRVSWAPRLSRLYLWTAVDFVDWVVGCVGVFLLWSSLHPLEPSALPHVAFAVSTSIVVSSAVVFVPGGLGLRELSLTGLMSGVLSPGPAAALALIYRITIAVVEVLWAAGTVLLVRPAREGCNGASGRRVFRGNP